MNLTKSGSLYLVATRLDQTIVDMVSYMKLVNSWALSQSVIEPCQLPSSLADLSETAYIANCLTLDNLDSAFFDHLADIQGFHNHSKCSSHKHNDSREVPL